MSKKRTIYLAEGYIAGFNPEKPSVSTAGADKRTKPSKGSTPRTRGTVYRFSKRSRRELLKTLARIPRQAIPEFFITLTYPPGNPSYDIKAHLNRLGNGIRYNYPEGWFVYRIERGERTKAKFHVHLVGTLGGVQRPRSPFAEWLSDKWLKIGGFTHYDPKRLVKVESLKDWDASTKYLSKPEGLLLSMDGHRWGVMNKKNLPQTEISVFEVDADTYERVKGIIADYLEAVKLTPVRHKTPKGMADIVKHREDYINRFSWQADFFNGFLPDDVVEKARGVVLKKS